MEQKTNFATARIQALKFPIGFLKDGKCYLPSEGEIEEMATKAPLSHKYWRQSRYNVAQKIGDMLYPVIQEAGGFFVPLKGKIELTGNTPFEWTWNPALRLFQVTLLSQEGKPLPKHLQFPAIKILYSPSEVPEPCQGWEIQRPEEAKGWGAELVSKHGKRWLLWAQVSPSGVHEAFKRKEDADAVPLEIRNAFKEECARLFKDLGLKADVAGKFQPKML